MCWYHAAKTAEISKSFAVYWPDPSHPTRDKQAFPCPEPTLRLVLTSLEKKVEDLHFAGLPHYVVVLVRKSSLDCDQLDENLCDVQMRLRLIAELHPRYLQWLWWLRRLAYGRRRLATIVVAHELVVVVGEVAVVRTNLDLGKVGLGVGHLLKVLRLRVPVAGILHLNLVLVARK